MGNDLLSSALDPSVVCKQNSAISGAFLLFMWGLVTYYVLGKILEKLNIHLYYLHQFLLGLALLEAVLWATNSLFHWWSISFILIPFSIQCP